MNYKAAGVDVEAGNSVTEHIKPLVKQTHNRTVLNGIGGFGALLDLKPLLDDYRDPILVQSIDGLGTKPMIAKMMDDYSTLGYDLLSATANDILVMGAKPLWLLDYIANDKLDPERVSHFINGLVAACQRYDVALVGGETAEMPNVYQAGEMDIAGMITGVVERDNMIDGQSIEVGDLLIGLSSNGLHTNGYSLARHILFNTNTYQVDTYSDELGETFGEALLKPHLNYAPIVLDLMSAGVAIHGMSHITGGGLVDNLSRILPHHVSATLDMSQTPTQPIFDLLVQQGKLSQQEAFQTFNMGVGYVFILPESSVASLQTLCQNTSEHFHCFHLGRIVSGNQTVALKS